MKYHEALKESVGKEEWKVFLTKLWNETDWNTDYEETKAKITIWEKMPDCIKMVFMNKHWEIRDLLPKYARFIPKKDQMFIGGIVSEEIKRLALLEKKPKEFAWLLERAEAIMGHSSIVDYVIKDGIKNLTSENPDKYYLKSYLGCVLV